MPDHESKVKDKIHDRKSLPSSSGSDDDKPVVVDKFKKMSYRVFDRHKPVHNVVGGGKFADIILWKNKKTSGIVFGVGTTVWFLFEVMDYNLITFASHTLIMSLASMFLWSNVSIFINKTPPKVPEVTIPENCLLDAASTLRTQLNQALAFLHKIGTGTDVKMFLVVNAGLWVISIIGKCCHVLTLVYIGFIWMFTVPVLYENHKDKVDLYAEKAMVEIKKQYAILDAKMPKGESNKKKD